MSSANAVRVATDLKGVNAAAVEIAIKKKEHIVGLSTSGRVLTTQ